MAEIKEFNCFSDRYIEYLGGGTFLRIADWKHMMVDQ